MRALSTCLSIGLIVLGGCSTVPQESLRLATFNAYLLSPIFRCVNATAPDCVIQNEGKSEGWAEDLANRILSNQDSLDVIALNEVWDEDARAILANRLSSAYPVQIRKIGRQLADLDLSGVAAPLRPRIFGEDSGLMLFAKRDFSVLPLPVPSLRWNGDANTPFVDALDSTTAEVGYQFYRHCAGVDCLASKGVGLVRLQHRRGGPIFNVFFTHMQADPEGKPEEEAKARGRQFDEIRAFILANFPDFGTRSFAETFILLGDLNVPFLKRSGEWSTRFANPIASPAASFFSTSLVESWTTTSSLMDLTPTNLKEEERLDYILIGPAPIPGMQTPTSVEIEARRSCVQHLTVPETFVRHASDHSMVHADVNLAWWHCSPRRALVVDAESGNDIVSSPAGAGDTIEIKHPGSIQWFFVSDREVATYSIGTDKPSKLTVEVYLPNDMTHAVSRYNITDGIGLPPRGDHGGSFKTNLYAIQGPFFVRVSGKERKTAVNYQLSIRKHDCATKETACLLEPGKPHGAKLSGESDLNGQHEAWFRYDVTGTLTEGGLQTIGVKAGLVDAGSISAELVDSKDPSGAPPLVGSLDTTLATQEWKGSAAGGASGYVRIWQNRPAAVTRHVSATFDTSIRFLEIKDLTCEDETNPEWGSDDIFTNVTIDGVQHRVPLSGTRAFDCDDSMDARNWGAELGLNKIAFAGKVEVRLYEKDDITEDDASRVRELPGPAPGTDINNKPVKWNFDGGRYTLSFESRRRENAPRADP